MIDEIIEELHFKYNLDKDIVEKAVLTPYIFLRDIIARGDLESVRVANFGLFLVKPFRRIKLEERENKHEQRKEHERLAGDMDSMETEHVAKQGDGKGGNEEGRDVRGLLAE